FEANYVAKIKEDVKPETFQKIMNVFIGKYDFSSFMKKDRALRNTVREIYKIKCMYNLQEKRYYIEICGSSFLKTMVRIMIGTALDTYFKGENEDCIKRKLENPDADQPKTLSPAEGLYLYKVGY
ncbi:MAG: tRNA pseudouridine(38-40) synthase TruA, partial [Leptotrichiaceae bacterium]|nr:tRNA pseudouridine(38-40) synthase TruA [Leptotrichiaceae bacterium]